MLALWGLLTHGTHAGTGDEPHYLAITHSIAFDGDLDLANNYGAAEPLVGGGVLQPESHVRPGVAGVMRPVHDVGMPLVFAPVVRVLVPVTNLLTRIVPGSAMQRARLNPPVLYRHLLSLVMAVLATMLAGMMFDAFVLLGASQKTALWMTALLVLSPPLLIFSILFFTELLSALLCFVVFFAIAMRDARGAARWWWLGCATGFLFLIHARNVGLTLPLTALGLYHLRGRARRHEAAAFIAGVAALVIVRTAVNYWFWGTLVSSPHARVADWPGVAALLGEMTTRKLGLLVDQEFGLLIYAPVYACALAGAFALWKTRRDVAVGYRPDQRVLRHADHLSGDERARLDRWLESRGPLPDADRAAARPVRVRRLTHTAARPDRCDCRVANRHQRLRLAASESTLERRRRPGRVLRAARHSRLR